MNIVNIAVMHFKVLKMIYTHVKFVTDSKIEVIGKNGLKIKLHCCLLFVVPGGEV